MKKEKVTIIFICLLLLISSINIIQSKELDSEEYSIEISPEKLNEILKEKSDFVIIDLRTYEEYYNNHIPKAKTYPYTKFYSDIPKKLNIFIDKQIILYSQEDTISRDTLNILKNKGFEKVSRLVGGYNFWETQGYNVIEEETCCIFYGNYPVMKNFNPISEVYNQSVVEYDSLLRSSISNPPEFSWKNVDGKDWATPVKDQGNCGSCWAFSAIGTMEAAINLARGDPDFDRDLSEQYVLSCLPAAGNPIGGCQGGHTDSALAYIISENEGPAGNGINGVPLESCMPYTATDTKPCSSKCNNWDTYHNPPEEDDVLFQLNDYHVSYLNCRNPSDQDIIKQKLIEFGPISTYIYMSPGCSSFWANNNDPNDYYPDPNSGGTRNHAIVLVGYKDDSSIDNGGYWILKNSWGTSWGYGGYFNVEYGGLRVGDQIMWVTAPEWEDPEPPDVVKLNLTYPVGGEIWREGDEHEIKWTQENLTSQIELLYSIDNGETYRTINRVSATNNKYTWRIPGEDSNQCKIKIKSTEYSLYDELNGTFTIIPFNGSLSLTQPNGGELLQEGQSYPIKWEHINLTHEIQLYFSPNGNKKYEHYIGNAPVSDKVYNWIVPSYNSTNCYIKIVSPIYSSMSDESDKAFSIKSLFNMHNATLPGLRYCSVDWGDYDNDGDLDVIMTGDMDNLSFTKIFENKENKFEYSFMDIIDVKESCTMWGDYDNDGDLDLVIAGFDGTKCVTEIYQNNLGRLTLKNTNLIGIKQGSVDWGDYDNDGDLDLLIAGFTGVNCITLIYNNNGGNFNPIDTDLTGVKKCSVSWGDYDNDTDLDLVISGLDDNNRYVTEIYQNNNSNFSRLDANILKTYASSVEWGDYDNDGDLDLLLSGKADIMNRGKKIKFASYLKSNNDSIINKIIQKIKEFIQNIITQIKIFLSGNNTNDHLPYASVVYQNNNGVFEELDTEIIGIWRGCAKWVDYNNDNLLDITISGRGTDGPITKIYSNNNGDFKDIRVSLENVYDCSFDWGDYDSDDDLDLLICGYDGEKCVARIYQNKCSK